MMKLNTLYKMDRLDEFVKERNMKALDIIKLFHSHFINYCDDKFFIVEQKDDELILTTFYDMEDFESTHFSLYGEIDI